MRAAVLHRFQAPLKIEDVETPKIGTQEVLVETKSCGMCHTDVGVVNGAFQIKLPKILGHEPAGIVTRIGKQVKGVREGERAVIDPLIVCHTCDFCLTGRENLCEMREKVEGYGTLGRHINGGFAEYLKVPVENLIKLPKEISFDEGAILVDAVATAFHAVRRANINPMDKSIAIFGVGGLGVNAIQFTRMMNWVQIIAVDIMNDKLKLAKDFGADEIVNSSEEDPVKVIRDLTDGKGADITMEFVGSPQTMEYAVESLKRDGKAVIVGCSASPFRIMGMRCCLDQINILGSYGASRAEKRIIVDLVRRKKIRVERLITHRFSLDEINHAIEVLDKKIGNPVRIIIKP